MCLEVVWGGLEIWVGPLGVRCLHILQEATEHRWVWSSEGKSKLVQECVGRS